MLYDIAQLLDVSLNILRNIATYSTGAQPPYTYNKYVHTLGRHKKSGLEVSSVAKSIFDNYIHFDKYDREWKALNHTIPDIYPMR